MVLVQVEYVSTGEDEELVQVVELCTGDLLSKVSITLVIACMERNGKGVRPVEGMSRGGGGGGGRDAFFRIQGAVHV